MLKSSSAAGSESVDAGLVWSNPILKVGRTERTQMEQQGPTAPLEVPRVYPFRQEHDHVVVGSRQVTRHRDRVPCGVVATVQWLWIVDSLRFDPEWCFLGQDIANSDWLVGQGVSQDRLSSGSRLGATRPGGLL